MAKKNTKVAEEVTPETAPETITPDTNPTPAKVEPHVLHDGAMRPDPVQPGVVTR